MSELGNCSEFAGRPAGRSSGSGVRRRPRADQRGHAVCGHTCGGNGTVGASRSAVHPDSGTSSAVTTTAVTSTAVTSTAVRNTALTYAAMAYTTATLPRGSPERPEHCLRPARVH